MTYSAEICTKRIPNHTTQHPQMVLQLFGRNTVITEAAGEENLERTQEITINR